ncbi:flagellar biosynthesis protein FlhF [Paraliobacillus ryukyuensis]|uniref:Flagellar biosynthesis protein FlhF n=1 Tax=Paraliobacillus ryukyuensis TaxID=200904 RepID=A0A366EH99_9BACI|nr:flagellar biosynthesis protein FlhF [Paraliobacillus ryukyuensis]RBP01782.1 flagellar biosynthesis protein FlhF [Paraliobacillus ryukyuensis]
MKVKKYLAPTMPEVMSKVRKELGNDAVILNSKVIYTGGIFGLFKKKNIEVIAAIDPDVQSQQSKKNNQHNIQSTKNTPSLPEQITNAADESNTSHQVLLDEVRSLRKWMEKTTSQKDQASFSAAYQTVYEQLIAQEVDETLARELISHVDQQFSNEAMTLEQAKRFIQNEIKTRLDKIGCGGLTFNKKFIHLVGPTGVGKTTTIAKLAANFMLKERKRVALITTDTYRIAAIEQLKTYSKILGIPIEIAYSIEDFQKATEKLKDYDLVIVDTAGRNFRDDKYVKALGQVVDLENDIETYLVLSLTTKYSDLAAIYHQFQHVVLRKLIFTKVDETASYGAMLNIAYENDIGIAYLTTGQDVPDDIEEASSDKISKLIVEANTND